MEKSFPDKLRSRRLISLQEEATLRWHSDGGSPSVEEDPVLLQVLSLHGYNYTLWHLEDQARRRDVADSVIAEVKRNIDLNNQKRNDTVETLDELVTSELAGRGLPDADAPLHSETVGSIIDRLSVLALKIYHVKEETERRETEAGYRARSQAKLEILIEQRIDLATCLDQLLQEVCTGRRRVKVYRQFKLYNDPGSNPALYRQETLPQGMASANPPRE